MEKQRPWWLSDGTENCHECTHSYHYEMGLRCASCDRGVCTHCAIVLHEIHEVRCAQCSAAEQED